MNASFVKSKKILYMDCETTGLSAYKNDIIQLAGFIEINGEFKEEFNFRMRPVNPENINDKALEINGLKKEDIMKYPDPAEIYCKIVALFNKYIDKFNREDKFIVCGYNVKFDIDFLNCFFRKFDDNFLFSFIDKDVIDPYPVLSYLRGVGAFNAVNLKLKTACLYFGIDLTNSHEAMADIKGTKALVEALNEKIDFSPFLSLELH